LSFYTTLSTTIETIKTTQQPTTFTPSVTGPGAFSTGEAQNLNPRTSSSLSSSHFRAWFVAVHRWLDGVEAV
jgi:hypothetical protein